jgi:U-box domain
MKFPYRDATTNKVYERGAILEWIWFGSATCPLTRKPLHPDNFSLDEALMCEIRDWKRLHEVEASETEAMNDDDDSDTDDEQNEEVADACYWDEEQKKKEKIIREHVLSLREASLKSRVQKVLQQYKLQKRNTPQTNDVRPCHSRRCYDV